MGGPTDEKPPILLSSDPKDQALNTKPSEINLTFDEYVKLENPNNQIIITPKIETDKVEFLAIKTRVNIKLNQELEDSTTYVFNFQKSVQDITENNPVEKLKLVFSTGNSIDSLTLKGKIGYVFQQDNEEFEDILVGLYYDNDTLDLFSDAPYYISQADSSGKFEITNIKSGTFKVYAWHDVNNSLKAEFRSEAYGFLSEPLTIDKNIDNIQINLFRADLTDLKINRSAPSGSNFDIILSKPIIEYEVFHPNINNTMFHRISDKTIRIYHKELENDSTEIRLSLMDSVGFKVDTTLMARFETSERAKEKLEITVNSGEGFLSQINAELSFNKPIYNINFDSLYISYDSAGLISINNENLEFEDSTKNVKLLISINVPDSIKNNSFTLIAKDSTFQDIEELWNESIVEANYTKFNPENLADGIIGTINTEERPLMIQLLDNNEKIIQQKYLEQTNQFEFTDIEASNYKIRVIVDRNQNKKWDPGNLYEKRQPEPIYYFYDTETQSSEFILRGGWTLNDIILEPRQESGIQKTIYSSDQLIIEVLPKEIMDITDEDLSTNVPG
ncbi:MAG: Ig-like domain-containing domain [Cyclobacteriaceae bacterium]